MILLKSIHNALKEMPIVKRDDKDWPLIVRVDHVSFGCFCEGFFDEEFGKIYGAFRLRFNFETKKRKLVL